MAAYIQRWQPSSVSPQAAAFARDVVTAAVAPGGRERAKNLLWAAGRLADWAIGAGAGAGPGGAAAPVGDRAVHRARAGPDRGHAADAAHEPAVPGPAVVPQLAPADAPLPRERAKAPYSPAEIDGYLALAARPADGGAADARRRAGLPRRRRRADPRRPAGVRGTDITCRSGGVIVAVRGSRPRAVPVLARYHEPLLASAAFAGTGLVTGGHDPARRNVTTPLIPRPGRRDRPAPAGHQPAARHLAGRLRRAARAGHVHARRRDHLQPAARRPARHPAPRRRGRGGGAARAGSGEHPARRGSKTSSTPPAIAPRIEALLPTGVRHRQLSVRTLLLGMMLTLADRRPAHLTEVHAALTALPAADQARLGVTAGLEDRPAPAHLPPGRAHLRPRHRRAGQRHPGRRPLRGPRHRAAMTCWKPASRPSTRTPAPRWPSTGPTWRPSPARRTTAAPSAPTPKRPGGTATPTCPAPKARCSSATTCPPPP